VGEVDHVSFAATAEETVAALVGILEDDQPDQSRLARITYAQGHSWEARAAEAFEVLENLELALMEPR
jgi:hypothetical protein